MPETVKSWIEERRAIHARAELKAKVEKSDRGTIYTAWTGAHDSGGLPEDDREHIADSYPEGAEAITDALNMFPRALDALNAVLELHRPVKHREWIGKVWRDQTGSEWKETTVCEECTRLVNDLAEWEHEKTYVECPCPTAQAIEGAIND